MFLSHRRYLAILAVLFGLWWLALAIHPLNRSAWMMENAVALGAVAGLAALHRRLLLSRASYTLIFLFLCLHLVGAHDTSAAPHVAPGYASPLAAFPERAQHGRAALERSATASLAWGRVVARMGPIYAGGGRVRFGGDAAGVGNFLEPQNAVVSFYRMRN